MNRNRTLTIVLSSLAGVGLLLLLGLYSFFFPTTTYLKYGLLNRQGQFVIPPKFDRLSDSSDGSYLGKNYAYDEHDWKFWYCCLYDKKVTETHGRCHPKVEFQDGSTILPFHSKLFLQKSSSSFKKTGVGKLFETRLGF